MGVVMKIVRYRLRDKDVDHDAGLSYLPITDCGDTSTLQLAKCTVPRAISFPSLLNTVNVLTSGYDK